MTPVALTQLRRAILGWYRRCGRDLPWRRTRDPYAILVSEFMLQQTQVDRVVPKFEAFVDRFPTLQSLSEARLGDVLRMWSGLGYNGRARRLWELARIVRDRFGGQLPAEAAQLGLLPGIGDYTAAAVACFAFDMRTATVDTNIRRVLARSLDGVEVADHRRALELAALALPRARAHEWNQALMDVGALFCRPKPKCGACPARATCLYRIKCSGRASERQVPGRALALPGRARKPKNPFEGSRRYYRGRIVKALAAVRGAGILALGEQVKPGFTKTDLPWFEEVLDGLKSDGLIRIDRKRRRARLP